MLGNATPKGTDPRSDPPTTAMVVEDDIKSPPAKAATWQGPDEVLIGALQKSKFTKGKKIPGMTASVGLN